MSATLASANLAPPLRPLVETAAMFRQECAALDHLIEELYRDVEQLREELVRKSDEIEEGRRKLADRGRQLAEQRKESSRLMTLLEQQEARAGETLTEVKSLREQLAREREESAQREATRTAFLEQKMRAAEGERDQLRHELNVLQATAAANGSAGGSPVEALAPLLSELGEMRRQLAETQAQLGQTQTQLGEARTQLGEAIERSVAAAVQSPAAQAGGGAPDRERLELESELELVRTRATELQEVVNQQRRELVEQRADVTTELRLLRELVEQRGTRAASSSYEPEEEPALVGAASRGEAGSAPADPVVSSVMAQFARLQKDVAQRRKKK